MLAPEVVSGDTTHQDQPGESTIRIPAEMVNHSSIRRDHFTERSTILQNGTPFCRTAPTGHNRGSERPHSLLGMLLCYSCGPCNFRLCCVCRLARSGRVAQVPFSSACFWRGLHYCRTTSSVWVGLAYAAVVYACSCERAALREVYSMMFWKHTMVGTAH